MPPSTWVLDPSKSSIGFSVRHIMITTVVGVFPDSEARITIENGSFENASIHFKAETKSVTTNNKERDIDLKKAIFFNVKKFPYLLFVSSMIARNEAGDYTVMGDLIVKGRTQSIQLVATFVIPPFEKGAVPIANVTFTGKINRRDFGFDWNITKGAGGLLIGEEVNLVGQMVFFKQD